MKQKLVKVQLDLLLQIIFCFEVVILNVVVL